MKISWADQVQNELRNKKKKTAVFPNIHNVSHGLMRVRNRMNLNAAFSAPNKLLSLCRTVNVSAHRKFSCTKKDQRSFVTVIQGVVYSILLSCSREYVGQRGRCLNDRWRERFYNTHKIVLGHLGIHCRDCGCVEIFEKQSIIGNKSRPADQRKNVSSKSSLLYDKHVSSPSVTL